jgi:hypothetical protein
MTDTAVEELAQRAHRLPTDQKLLIAAALVVKGGDHMLVAEALTECALNEIKLRQLVRKK